MYEYAGNLHVHTTYSDGAAPHDVVAAAAIRAGLDFLIVTDHNVWVHGVEGVYQNRRGNRVLLLTGEEVHDMLRRDPQGNHLLVYGAQQELAPLAQGRHPQHLLDAVSAAGGLSFIAHPIDRAVPWAGESAFNWLDWDISGYTGLELWNYMSTIKALLPDPLTGLRTIYDPAGAMIGPDAEILALWDDLLRQGQRVPVIGSADAHGSTIRRGPLRKTIYPYDFLFRCVNTHVLLEQPLSGDWLADGMALYGALAAGHAFIGYGLPGSPRGFRFEAVRGGTVVAVMGDQVALEPGISLRLSAPAAARLRLIHDGQVVAERVGKTLSYTPEVPGAYRAEAWKCYRGRERGWIFSNPIYCTAKGGEG